MEGRFEANQINSLMATLGKSGFGLKKIRIITMPIWNSDVVPRVTWCSTRREVRLHPFGQGGTLRNATHQQI